VKNRFGIDAAHADYKWWALSCTSLGMLLVATNSGTLIIALPDLERALGTSLLELVWVILAYMIASTVLVLTAGRLSDLFGRKGAFVAGFLLFGAASLGAGFSANGTQLILWRIVQGVGGAFIFANGPALVTDAFPREQLGLAMGTNTMVAAIGLVLGPVLGGALVAISWQWVFWFNVPLALAGALWAALVLRELARRDTARGLEGIVLVSIDFEVHDEAVAEREVVLTVVVDEDTAPEIRRLQHADEGFGELADGLAGEARAHLFLHHIGELDEIVGEVRSIVFRYAIRVRSDVDRLGLTLPGSHQIGDVLRMSDPCAADGEHRASDKNGRQVPHSLPPSRVTRRH